MPSPTGDFITRDDDDFEETKNYIKHSTIAAIVGAVVFAIFVFVVCLICWKVQRQRRLRRIDARKHMKLNPGYDTSYAPAYAPPAYTSYGEDYHFDGRGGGDGGGGFELQPKVEPVHHYDGSGATHSHAHAGGGHDGSASTSIGTAV
ncbi:hypothetical protein G7046_g1666 [Stylonectria norvegica]|nr:hypothetical protein G7046_g1666 [Stylonectria norvegica]